MICSRARLIFPFKISGVFQSLAAVFTQRHSYTAFEHLLSYGDFITSVFLYCKLKCRLFPFHYNFHCDKKVHQHWNFVAELAVAVQYFCVVDIKIQ